MAPIEHADSIIEESVISTSPYRQVDTDNDASTSTAETSLPRRVTRMYGKQKTNQNEADERKHTYESRAHTLRTAPPSAERLVIPESEDASISLARNTSDSSDWREKLKEIDAKFDNQTISTSAVTTGDPFESFSDENQDGALANSSLFDGTLSSLLSEVSLTPPEPIPQETKDNIDDHPNRTTDISSDDGTGTEEVEANTRHINEGRFRAEKASKTRQKKKVGKQRPKKASRKELMEMQKESARLLAERTVEIKRPEQRPVRTIRELFGKLMSSSRNMAAGSSDPILSFSSPDNSTLQQKIENSAQVKVISPTIPHHSTPRKEKAVFDEESDLEQNSDIELPTAESLLKAENTKHAERLAEEVRMKELKERKLLALTSQTISTSSDDDLEVEQLVTPRKSYKKSVGNAFQNHTRLRHTRNSQGTQMTLERAAKLLFADDAPARIKTNQQNTMSRESLNQILLQRVEKQSLDLEEKKKQKWVEHGGSLKTAIPSGESSIESWLRSGMGNAEQDDELEDNGDVNDRNVEKESSMEGEDDMQYEIEHGSEGENSGEEAIYGGGDVSSEEEDEDKENQRPMPRRTKSRVVVDSDDENESNFAEPIVLVSDSSHPDNFGSSKGRYGDPERLDENLTGDHDANDENVAFPAFKSTTFKPISHKRFDSFDRDLSQGPEPSLSRSRSHGRILRVLHEEDKENTLASIHSTPSDPGVELSFSNSTELLEGSTLVTPASLSQLFTNTGKAVSEEPSPTPLLPRGFSQFFSLSGNEIEKKSQEAPKGTKFGGVASKSREGEFEFTQPTSLLPSVQISESQRREVDNMFNKDQDFKLDEAKRSKVEGQSSSLIRPKVPYFGSFIASPQADISPIIRQPLATMSLRSMDGPEEITMADEGSPQEKLTRLRKERPLGRSKFPSPSPAPQVRNAFEVLKDASINKSQKHVRKATVSEFIEGEAQESDDEFYAGFGGMNKERNDDEDENEDQDAVVEGLVDDTALDDKTLAEALVLEKHKEFEEQNEAALLKLHQDAIEGKLRIKRKSMGLGFDDSESEDEDQYRPRRHLPKKRRIEGDTLEACAQNPETRPFFDTYQQSLLEDEDQFNPVEHSTEKEHHESMSEEEEDDDEKVVNTSTIRAELRERLLKNEEDEIAGPNLEDVTWVDTYETHTSDDVEVEIEQCVLQGKSGIQSSRLNALRFNGDFMTNGASSQEKTRLKAWASQESQNRSAGGRGGFSRKSQEGKGKGGSVQNSNRRHPAINNGGEDSTTRQTATSSSFLTMMTVQRHKRFED